jgi:hypothetical protein
MAEQPKKVSANRVNQVAGDAVADPRTVRKVIEGKPVRGDVAVRIDEALRKRGLR